VARWMARWMVIYVGATGEAEQGKQEMSLSFASAEDSGWGSYGNRETEDRFRIVKVDLCT
jgi:hypothetical protein